VLILFFKIALYMKRYLEQLIEDMQIAAMQVPFPEELWESVTGESADEIDDFSDLEEFINGPVKPLSEVVGIDSFAFPPAEKLTTSQIKLLYIEMYKLLEAYNFVADFPVGLPYKLRYEILRKNWDKEVVFMSRETIDLEFCEYNTSRCPFPPRYCDCRFWEEEDRAEEQARNRPPLSDGELPF
jgi:hypothetical protein